MIRRNKSIGESCRPLWLSLIDELCNARPALALTNSLRREALEEADSSRLGALYDVCGRGVSAPDGDARDVYAGEGYGVIDGWRWTSQA
jgi:hypothetical protein